MYWYDMRSIDCWSFDGTLSYVSFVASAVPSKLLAPILPKLSLYSKSHRARWKPPLYYLQVPKNATRECLERGIEDIIYECTQHNNIIIILEY